MPVVCWPNTKQRRPPAGMDLDVILVVSLSFNTPLTSRAIPSLDSHVVAPVSTRLCFHPSLFGHIYFNTGTWACILSVIRSNRTIVCIDLRKQRKSQRIPFTNSRYRLNHLTWLQAPGPKGLEHHFGIANSQWERSCYRNKFPIVASKVHYIICMNILGTMVLIYQ